MTISKGGVVAAMVRLPDGQERAIFVDLTTQRAIGGPLMESKAEADEFCDWLKQNTERQATFTNQKTGEQQQFVTASPRVFSDSELHSYYVKYRHTHTQRGNG